MNYLAHNTDRLEWRREEAAHAVRSRTISSSAAERLRRRRRQRYTLMFGD
jgi:hypothetical protein